MAKRKSKYNASKLEVDGIIFDSKKEAAHYNVLKERLDKGEISNLRMQVPYELIPRQLNSKGKVEERACTYVADFVFEENGEEKVVDTKGMRLSDYKIKRKLMLWLKGIKIIEV